MNELKNLRDLEQEIQFLEKNFSTAKSNKPISEILFRLASGIEYSMQTKTKPLGLFKKLFAAQRFKKFLSPANTNTQDLLLSKEISGYDPDPKMEILRIKTALTAFKLHSGPFASHPIFGGLDKKDWELVHLKTAQTLLETIQVDGREKFEKNHNFKKKKYYKNKNFQKNKKRKPRE
jgi:hypothetical protein